MSSPSLALSGGSFFTRFPAADMEDVLFNVFLRPVFVSAQTADYAPVTAQRRKREVDGQLTEEVCAAPLQGSIRIVNRRPDPPEAKPVV
jgi:hypothetical protein